MSDHLCPGDGRSRCGVAPRHHYGRPARIPAHRARCSVCACKRLKRAAQVAAAQRRVRERQGVAA
ncbi:MAG: hypothetical protein ACK53W_01245 [Gemmatimonadota bacterium]